MDSRTKPKRTIEDVLLIVNRQAKAKLESVVSRNLHGEVVIRIRCHGPLGLGKVRTKIVETSKPE